MKNLTFPCVVVTLTYKGEENINAFKSEKDFVNWAESVSEKRLSFFQTIESMEMAEDYYDDGSYPFPSEVFKKATFPVVHVWIENGEERIEKPENFSEGDFWFDVLSNGCRSLMCIGLRSEDEANAWAKSKAVIPKRLFEEMELLGWKISG